MSIVYKPMDGLFDYFRAFSKDKVKANLLPRVLMHSFTGSADVVNGLVRTPKIGKKFYFSFSAVINLQNSSKKLDAALAMVPEDRILLESDTNVCGFQDNGMKQILTYVSKIRNWTEEETATKTTNNAKQFFGLI